MNKSELIAAVAEKSGVTQAQAKTIVEHTLETIKDASTSFGKVSLLGFGTFTKSTRAARVGRNPQTGAPLQIAAKDVVKFKPYF